MWHEGPANATKMSALILSRTRDYAQPREKCAKISRTRNSTAVKGASYLLIMKMNESLTPFPLRTLMVCFTMWLIATEVLVFNQIKFNAKAELLEQASRALHGPEVVVPE